MAAIALAALGFVPTEEPAWADHGGPHDPDVVVTGSGSGGGLQEFCSQNPYHEVCGYGGGGVSGMVTCPYTGRPVSRPEDCPEFSGAGGGGGCADSSSSDCGSDDDGDADEEDLPESARTAADNVMACVSNSLLKGLYGRVESTVYQDLSHRGDHRLAEIRVDFDLDGDSMMTSAVFREIRFDRSAIQEEAEDQGVGVWQVLAHTVFHELRHAHDANQCAMAMNQGQYSSCSPIAQSTQYYGDKTLQAGASDYEGWVDSRAMRDYRSALGVDSYRYRFYDPDEDGSPECLPEG